MLKGILAATSDIIIVNQALKDGFKVIYLGDPISIDPMYKDIFVVSSSLTPDYMTLSLQVDGDENGFARMYMQSLNSPAAIEMISIIMACLYKGTNIMFYLPPEASGLNYVTYLLQFLQYNYGVTTQTKTTMFSFNPAFANKIIKLLYIGDLITSQEFLIKCTALDDIVLRKLVDEYRPIVENPSDIKCIIKWFNNYKNELLSADRALVNGVQYAGEVKNYGCY